MIGLLTVISWATVGCGPSCPEAKAALDASQIMAEDVARVNALVERRKMAMGEAEQGDLDTFEMQRIKFSVTAYELAIRVQLRVIKLSPRYEDSSEYDKNIALIHDARCLFDELLAAEGASVPDGVGRKVQRTHDQLKSLIRKDGTLTASEFSTYLEEGIQVGEEDY